MLKETETEKTIVYFEIFLSLEAFKLGGERQSPAPLPPPPPGYAYDLNSLTVATKKKTSSKLTFPVNFYYLFPNSALKVKTNIVLENGINAR